MPLTLTTVGILAGGGSLPPVVAEAARQGGREVVVIAFEGHAEPGWVAGYRHDWVRLGAVGRTLALLHRHGCDEVCMIGKVGRPSLAAVALDRRALAMLARLGAMDAGDDRLLRLIVAELEREGFRVVGADVLAASLLAPLGPLAGPAPDAAALADIARGVAVARALGEADVGQAVVVQAHLVLGVEAVEGTDALLARCHDLKRQGPGGVLVKGRKRGQERRVDLPTIGPATVDNAAAAGLRGIAVEAGHTLVAEADQLARRAERHGLFVVGVEPFA
ncbi:MAG: LpxI family protein [Geminicoccaceae bacterium]|nr:MAG: LpxI family protein [Geminicoccaceae bacterium]